jgi:membrane-bound lytic murein transglycosylase D
VQFGRTPWIVVAAAMVLGGLLAPPAAVAGRAFEVPPALRPQVDFWKDIFATYSKRHVVIHDTERPDRIYSVLDFRDLDQRGLGEVAIEHVMRDTVEQEKKRIRRLLLRLDRGDARPTPDEERIRDLFRDDPSPRRFLAAAAADRIRSQTGLRERFARGIAIGHRYFPEMEAIFRREGIPVQITRLPLVESCFNVHAYSKVGAAGVWQFMPATARHFMRIDEAIDERLDPIVSTRAAARFLRQNYERLGTWPLAIMAYNHGPGGIARAVRQLGTTDVTAIIERYDGRAFKFASRNFYPEFLAALEVERNHDDYFGPLPLDPPLRADVVRLQHYVSLKTVGRCAGGVDQIDDLNPGLLPAVRAGKQYIPSGYRLRLPAGRRKSFERCYAEVPAHLKFARQKRQYVTHRVRRGQTLGQIARRYGLSVEELQKRNGLRSKDLIRVGQVLRIPTS